MLISEETVINILKQYNIESTGVLHIGAHECEELKFYNKVGINSNDIIWIDGNKSKVLEAQNKGIPNVYYAIISDEDDKDVQFNITNNGQSSSILEFGTHSIHHPHVYFTGKEFHKSLTIDTFYKNNNLDMTKYNFWNFDIQGAELMALKGSKSAINYANAIYLEVNEEEVYKGCALISEIDEYLAKYNFKRVLTKMTEFHWGDALYIKNPISNNQ